MLIKASTPSCSAGRSTPASSACCARRWSRSRRAGGAGGRRCWEPRSRHVPAIRPPAPALRLSLRVAVLGGIAVALFAVLFFRLWNLQVLDGDEYLAEAKNNRTREYKVIAPRGNILDRNGNVLVDNRTSLALQLNTPKLPADPAEEKAELTQLGELAHMPLKKVRRTIREQRRRRRRGAGDAAPRRRLRPRLLPGREPATTSPASRSSGSSSATIPTAAAPPTCSAASARSPKKSSKEAPYKGLEPGDEVGKGGVEYTYDKYLRGEPGLTRIQVNALGQPTPGGQLVYEPPAPGDNLKLTIDPEVQAAGESALGLAGAARRLRDDERPQRRDARPRLLPRPSTPRSSPNR